LYANVLLLYTNDNFCQSALLNSSKTNYFWFYGVRPRKYVF